MSDFQRDESPDFVEPTEEEIKTFFVNLGILIKWRRLKKKISEETMGDAVGLNMYNVERGKENLTLPSILNIAKYLKAKPHLMIFDAMSDQPMHVFQEGIEKMIILNRKGKRKGENKK